MFKSKTPLINIKASPVSSGSLLKQSSKDVHKSSRSEADNILEELIRAARSRQSYIKDKKIKLGIVKLQEQPPNIIKIEDSDDEEKEVEHVHDMSRDRDQLRIRKAGKNRNKKIVKHSYFSNQDTLDKYVNHKVQSRHPRPPIRSLPTCQSTLDKFFGQARNLKISENF